ncbi:MAG TPA: HWE histidine kinase domain-containing protein [Sphingomicrobium sp.]|nr:HWE histidine kinase domain-containing protein [Sphingomicrobium sp.]
MTGPSPPQSPWSPEHLRLAIDAAGVALWSWNVDDNSLRMDARGFELWNLSCCDRVEFEDLSAHIHPADRDRVRAAFIATRSVAGAYEIDFRIIVGDDIRWISARGQGADAGISNREMFGVFLDVTERKQAEEGSELLAGEMSHRVKNLLSIAGGLTHLTSRSAKSVEDMAHELTQRLTALGRAHDVVRPLPGSQGKAALLGDLIAVLLAPYDNTAAFSGRIRVAVPRMGVGEQAATTLAMVIHELATNAVKHGALSTAAGTLDISSRSDDEHVFVIWSETGGPEIATAPQMSGYGSKLIERSLSNQLRGKLEYDWQGPGLVATLCMRKDRLAV